MTRIGTIKDEYKKSGLWAATKEVPAQGWGLVKENKGKTALVVGTLVVLAALTTAYFMSPAYAAFVSTAGAKAAAFVNPAITAVSAFLVAHPMIATVAIIGLVAAVITAGVLAYKNHDKANQIDGVKQKIVDACEKDGDNKPKVEGDKLKFNGDKGTVLDEICSIVRLTPAAPAK